MSKEDAPAEEPSSIESPIDVTSQEEEDNTAAEESSIEQDVPEPEQLTASEEVQEALFDNSTEQPVEGSEENAEGDEEAEGTEEVTASEEDEAAAAEDEDEEDEEAQADEAVTESQEQEAEAEEDEEDDEEAEDEDKEDATSAEAEVTIFDHRVRTGLTVDRRTLANLALLLAISSFCSQYFSNLSPVYLSVSHFQSLLF